MKTIENIMLRYADRLKNSEHDGSYMSVSYLANILRMVEELSQIIEPEAELEDWVDAKITIANEALSDVYTYLRK